MPLLQVDDLTVRFGGLVAVRNLSFTVERGQILSIIGPNGAGKTTVFNAVTGVHPATDGRMLFGGHELGRRLTWRVRLTCIFVGLLTGLVAMTLSVDADRLWRATIRHNMLIPPAARAAATDDASSISWSRVADDLVSYLRGDLAVEPSRRGWVVVSPHLNRELAQAAERPDAIALKLRLEEAVRGETGIDELSGDPRWPVAVDDARLEELRHARSYVRAAVFVGFAAGLVIGVASAYAVWHRSQRTPDVVAQGGIARTFQNIRLFREMTALENVLVGLDGARRSGRGAPTNGKMGLRRRPSHALQQATELLRYVGLDAKANSLAGSLAYGDQRRLEIARALATRPELLLLDEPAAGMNPTETLRLIELIGHIRNSGVTVLLIEHHMSVVMSISDRIVVLNYGSKIAEGNPAEVKTNPAVIEAYLGKDG